MHNIQRVAAPRKLTRAEEFRRVLAAPLRISRQSFLLRADVNMLSAARLGLIASRKAARRAVDRNRAKRLAREAFRAAQGSMPAVDVVLQLKNDLRDRDNASVRTELDTLLRDMTMRFSPTSPTPHTRVERGPA